MTMALHDKQINAKYKKWTHAYLPEQQKSTVSQKLDTLQMQKMWCQIFIVDVTNRIFDCLIDKHRQSTIYHFCYQP